MTSASRASPRGVGGGGHHGHLGRVSEAEQEHAQPTLGDEGGSIDAGVANAVPGGLQSRHEGVIVATAVDGEKPRHVLQYEYRRRFDHLVQNAAELVHHARSRTVQAGPIAGQRDVDARERSGRQIHLGQVAPADGPHVAYLQLAGTPVLLIERGFGLVDVVGEDGFDAATVQTGAYKAHAREELGSSHAAHVGSPFNGSSMRQA